MAKTIMDAALDVSSGAYDAQFPIDVFQTGSATSTNMNANEVIATLASRALASTVHPNDHVNRGQSSNDVIPTAIHVSAALALHEALLPALTHLKATIDTKAKTLSGCTKTGRTHLMDAMPITLEQELSGWATQIQKCEDRIRSVLPRLYQLAQGGTAVGTGINAHPKFSAAFAQTLAAKTKLAFCPNANFFEALSAQDTAVELSGQLKTLAVALMKIANDLRWMNSGPLSGLGEIALPDTQPGSSIMPGKVNPVIAEATTMVCAQVIGNDTTITIAGQSGNFQLNVMLPVIARNLLENIELLSNATQLLADRAIKDFVVQSEHIASSLAKNPILVTALNEVIGYEQGAAIAKRAYAEKRPLLDIALEMTKLDKATLMQLLDPTKLTHSNK